MISDYVGDRRRLAARALEITGREITLTPRTKTAKPAGGFEWTAQTPRAPQMFRPPRNTADATTIEESPTGIQRETRMRIIGAYDAVIAVDDTFTLDGESWVVAQLLPPTGWDLTAEVVRLG